MRGTRTTIDATQTGTEETGTEETGTEETGTAADGVALEVRGLTRTYRTTEPPTRVLDGIDLTVRAGEYLAVMGASGSGKSTLLHSISGMDRPTSGTVLLDGQDLTALTDTERSRVRLTRMGFVFQQPYFLRNLSVRDNVLLPALKAAGPRGRAAAVARVDALLERFGVAHVGRHGVTQVSGGELQRASICRALACGPSVLFADEPTGALNSSTTAEVMDALTDVHRGGATIVLVTHDPACAARADRVIYLRDGRVVDSRDLRDVPDARADEAGEPGERGELNMGAAARREDELLDWLRTLGF